MEVIVTTEFDAWLLSLPQEAQTRVTMRIIGAQKGNLGDHKSLGAGLWEMRIHSGSGYRIYYSLRGNTLIIVLAGGTKRRQQRDIARARIILVRETTHGTNPL